MSSMRWPQICVIPKPNIFPLHHYFLIYVNQCLNGYSISYAWPNVVALIGIYLLPQIFSFRLKDAFLNKEYKA